MIRPAAPPSAEVAPVATAASDVGPTYANPSAPLEARVNDLFTRLTPEERISLMSCDSRGFHSWMIDTPPIWRLGIPSIRTTDAPQGLRVATSTAFPMGVVMASTWDPDLIRQLGSSLGEEARTVGRQIIYGPSVNIQRTPQSGRFFENMSEDPFLVSSISDGYIEGLQSESVAACIKHYFGNNQEAMRHTLDVQVDERTLREIYLPSFYAAVTKAHTWALMASVNKINGVDVVASHKYMTDLLRTEWHWDGLAIADWSALHDTGTSLNAGVDFDIPDPRVYAPWAIAAVIADGSVRQATVDESVRRVIRLMVRTGLLDKPAIPKVDAINTPAHCDSLKTAEEGSILLKNANSLLPIDRTKIKSIAVIGPNASDTQLGGRWSAETFSTHIVSILQGVRAAAHDGIDVRFAQGCSRVGGTPDSEIQAAADLAAKSDIAIVVPGTDNNFEGEELDPPNLHLPGDQEKLIKAVAAANKNTIVVLNNGSPLTMGDWLPAVPALIESWYAGQEQGAAVAALLFGDVNPSGKLTSTIAYNRDDYSDWLNYPGSNNQVKYSEGIYVGYRHFDKANIAPMFPFGYGLSYTTFDYSNLKVPRATYMGANSVVTVTVKNTGTRAGDEIVELYVRDLHPLVDRPIRELKGFKRVALNPGEAKEVSIPIDDSSFSYWDIAAHQWRVNPGNYAIDVGSSSRDIRASANTRIK